MTAPELKATLDAIPGTSLCVLSSEEVEVIRREFPLLPGDYLQVVATVGVGFIGNGRFALYPRPIAPESIFGSDFPEQPHALILVGDDYAGGHAGYLLSSPPSFVFFDHCHLDEISPDAEETLSSFLADWFLEPESSG